MCVVVLCVTNGHFNQYLEDWKPVCHGLSFSSTVCLCEMFRAYFQYTIVPVAHTVRSC